MLAPFLSFSFDVKVFVRKCLFPSLDPSGEYEKCLREPKHFIFSLFVVTVAVTHPAFYESVLLFLLLTLDQVVLPQLASFESFTSAVLL